MLDQLISGKAGRAAFAAAALLALASLDAWAEGTFTHLSGKVAVQREDGTSVAGKVGSKVVQGDTVVTGTDGFVRMEMSDGGEMIVRPDSQLKIMEYRFDKAQAKEDSFIFKTLKGGFRAVTGLVGKRGNRDAYRADTPTATIGIRGTQYDIRVCNGNCGSLPNGTYVMVRFGSISTGNSFGNLELKPGQVAFIPPNQPPQLLPRDPGVGFTPPPDVPDLNEKKKKTEDQSGSNNGDGQNNNGDGQNNGEQNNGQNGQGDGEGGVSCAIVQ